MPLLAVYGTLKRGKGAHHLLANNGAKFVGEGITLEKFHMRSNSAYPAIFIPRKGETATNIHVEVYEISDELLRDIDVYEGVPILYYRKKVKVKLQGDSVVEAYLYICNDDNMGNFSTVITSGLWR